ncbi:MAG: glycine cleavage system aminomethyltransferase GcvT [Gemmobacter sp.]
MTDLLTTPLDGLSRALGGRMVDFAGYALPVQFPTGVMKEHLHTRAAASLFDVSHMGQAILRGAAVAERLEALIPADIVGLAEGRQRYGLFTSEAGGILDDLMVANRGEDHLIVVNAARKAHDFGLLSDAFGADFMPVSDRALIALQGPAAEAALGAMVPAAAGLRFMEVTVADWQGAALWISRSGYSGEDGFEISVPAARAEGFARALLETPAVLPAGLGARDSLRLEAGLCLYGHDIDEGTSPAEAALGWAIPKVRRRGGARAGGFPGAARILQELEAGPARLRVGLAPEGRAPVREGAPLFADPEGGAALGHVTSGGFAPSLDAPVAMGYLPAALAAPGTPVWAEVRGRRLPCTVRPLPFRTPTYKR